MSIRETAEKTFKNNVLPVFISGLKHEKTQKLYTSVISEFEEFCGKPFLILDNEDGDAFAAHQVKKYAPTTAYVRLGVIRSVAGFCEHNADELMSGTLFKNYSSPFKFIRANISHSDYANPDKVPKPAEIDYFVNHCSPLIRLATLMILKCGFTSQQLREMRVDDIITDSTNDVFVRLTKNGEPRFVYIPEDLVQLIQTYIGCHRITDDGYLFSNSRGKQCSERVLQKKFNSEAKKYNFNFTMQDLRNSSAAYMLAGGASKQAVMEQLAISRTWMKRFDLCHNQASIAEASSYSTIEIKPANFNL